MRQDVDKYGVGNGCINVLVGQHVPACIHTVLDCSIGAPVAFSALLSFTSAGHGTVYECAIDLGIPLVGTMVTSTESVQTPFTIELWVSVDPASIPSPLESRPLAILVGSFPRWYVGLTRVSPTDVHILFNHSDVTVMSENREKDIVDFEMIARDPEWQHIAVAVTIDASNEHLIRFICDGKVVSEMNRESTPSNIAELLSSSVSFLVGPPNVQSFPTLFQGFRTEPWFNVFGKNFEPSLLLADMCVAVCPEGAMKLADFSAPALQVSSRFGTSGATRPHPVHGGDSFHQRWTASRICCWEWRSVHGRRNHNGNKCRHSERRWKRWIEHTDHDALCVSRGKATRCSRVQGVPIQEWSTY